jgi:SPP1 family phage portal protein
MKIDDILLLGDWTKIIATIESANAYEFDPSANQEIYDGKHVILSRLDKPKKDENGNVIGTTPTAKMVLNYQKKIVESSVAFLFGSVISLIKSSEGGDEAFLFLKNALKKLKFDNQNRELARILFTQKRAAKLYYIKNPEDKLNIRLASIVLSSKNGSFYPNWDENGDMDAFLRTYTVNRLIDGKEKEVEIFELYTDTNIIKGEKGDAGWLEVSSPNPFQKIPVVYYEQEKAEWEDVQTLIDRQELSISELIDTNQYFASPIIKLIGTVTGMPNKEDQGKALNCLPVVNPQTGQSTNSDAQYLTWDQRPESLKMQFDLIEKYIFSFSQTADISFNNMIANKPGNISGVSLKLLMLDPILKSYNKQEIFDENIQRELSVVKAMLSQLNTAYANDYLEMQIDIQFNSILPDNIAEVVNYLSVASGGEPIISQETAVNKNPLVLDKEAEIAKLQSNAATQAGSFNLNNI